MDTYYTVLGVSETASDADIKAAYRLLIRQFHPDGLPNASATWLKVATDKTAELNEAYTNLSKFRHTYDAQIAALRPKPSGRCVKCGKAAGPGPEYNLARASSSWICEVCSPPRRPTPTPTPRPTPKPQAAKPQATSGWNMHSGNPVQQPYVQPYVTLVIPKINWSWKVWFGIATGLWLLVAGLWTAAHFAKDESSSINLGLLTGLACFAVLLLPLLLALRGSQRCAGLWGSGWFFSQIIILFVILNAIPSSQPSQTAQPEKVVTQSDAQIAAEFNARVHAEKPVWTDPDPIKLPPWNETFGAKGIPNAGIPYLNKSGRFYGADSCSVNGYGTPADQIDTGTSDHVYDPACIIPLHYTATVVVKGGGIDSLCAFDWRKANATLCPNSGEIADLELGDRVEVMGAMESDDEKVGRFYLVRKGGKEGWVAGKWIETLNQWSICADLNILAWYDSGHGKTTTAKDRSEQWKIFYSQCRTQNGGTK